MNVRCESCDTVYRIDPLKVPVEGVHARCTVCSAVIPIERTNEADAPATNRPMVTHVQSTEDRLAHALGDAFIPAPHDDDRAGSDEGDDDLAPEEALTEEEREAERNSERQAVESMPGIIMPPTDDDYYQTPKATFPEPVESPPDIEDVDQEDETAPSEPVLPRVSRPFVPPSDLRFAKPTLEKSSQQIRPTAPVFRPTPGRPAQTPIAAPPPTSSVAPPAAPKPFRPPVSPPMSPPTAPPAPPPPSAPLAASPPLARPSPFQSPAAPPPAPPPPPAPAAPTRPINPFLSKDPGQKARRLARALISDMIVYQPEKRQKALEDGTLADAFEEEIKKSWEEYVDQVGEDLANSTTYFNDALNELLADGEKMF